MLETKTFTVSPENKQATIDLASNFGWNLKSSQEINNTDSHLENRGGTVYNVTTKEHYVKLVLERDTAMKNYNQIVKLEKQYFSIMEQEPVKREVKISAVITIIGLLLYVAPGVLYLVYKFWRRSQANKEYEAAYSEWMKQREIAVKGMAEARQLLD